VDFSFHLFQRVVGFQHAQRMLTEIDKFLKFPSLSESSEFLTFSGLFSCNYESKDVSISFRE